MLERCQCDPCSDDNPVETVLSLLAVLVAALGASPSTVTIIGRKRALLVAQTPLAPVVECSVHTRELSQLQAAVLGLLIDRIP